VSADDKSKVTSAPPPEVGALNSKSFCTDTTPLTIRETEAIMRTVKNVLSDKDVLAVNSTGQPAKETRSG
jgi:hypothetical protein